MRYLLFNKPITIGMVIVMGDLLIAYITFYQFYVHIPRSIALLIVTSPIAFGLLLVFVNLVLKRKIVERMLGNPETQKEGRMLLSSMIARNPKQALRAFKAVPEIIRKEYANSLSAFISQNWDNLNLIQVKDYFQRISLAIRYTHEHDIKEKMLKLLIDILGYFPRLALRKEEVFELTEHLRDYAYQQFYTLLKDRQTCTIYSLQLLGILAGDAARDPIWDWMHNRYRQADKMLEYFDDAKSKKAHRHHLRHLNAHFWKSFRNLKMPLKRQRMKS